MFTQVFFPIHNIIMNDKVCICTVYSVCLWNQLTTLCIFIYTLYLIYTGPVGLYVPIMFIFIVFNILVLFHPLRMFVYTTITECNSRIADSCRLLYLCIRCTNLHISTCIIHLFRYVRPSVPHTGSCSLPQRCSQFDP